MAAPLILLAPMAVSAGKYLVELALTESNNDRKAAKYEAETAKADMLRKVRKLELDVEKTAIESTTKIELARIESQREVARDLIALAKTVFERKADMLQHMYDKTSDTLQNRISELTEQQKQLSSAKRKASSDERRDIMEEIRYIGNELADLQSAMASLNADFTSAMTILEISGTPSSSALLEKI
jgi:hypothetical protein